MNVVSPNMFPEKFETVLRRPKARLCGLVILALPILWIALWDSSPGGIVVGWMSLSTIIFVVESIFVLSGIVFLKWEVPTEIIVKKRIHRMLPSVVH